MLARVFALLAIALLAATPAQAAKRVALVIGNQAYPGTATTLRPLHNPRLDAERLARLLQSHGFEVISCDRKTPGCFDLTREKLNEALDDLKAAAKNADLALVFYAGHGLQVAEGNVLAPIDMELKCEDAAQRRGVVLTTVLDAMAAAKQKIVVMDACRNDPLTQCPGRGAVALSFGAFNLPAAESLLLVASTKPGQLANDGLPGAHSPFARALFHWLEQAAHMPFDQMFNRVAAQVIDDTTRGQFTQVPERLVRGVAPEQCFAGKNCSADPEAAKLRQQVETMTAERARDQDLVRIAQAYLRSRGSGNAPLSAEQMQAILGELTDTGRDLAARRTPEGDRALESLGRGDAAPAETLLQEVLDRARAAADTRRAEAAKAARQLAALARPRDIAKAADYYRQAVELVPADPETWINLGEALRDAGRTNDAKRSFEQAAHHARGDGDIIHRTKANYRLGDIALAQGNLASAQRLYETAMAIIAPKAAAEPTRLDWQREVSVSHIKLGDVLVAQGNLPAALDAFNASHTIFDRLAKADPGNAGWQRDLSVSQENGGDVLVDQGNLPSALDAFNASLAIRERLAKADPGNAGWQRDVFLSYWRVADIERKQGNHAAALTVIRTGEAIMIRLAALDQGNAEWQRDLTTVHEFVGDVLVEQGNLPAALDAFNASLAIRDRLAKADPGNAGWQRDLSVSHHKIGDVLRAQGNLAAAFDAFNASLAIAERLAKADPGNAGWQRDLSVSHDRLGRLLERMSRKSEPAPISP